MCGRTACTLNPQDVRRACTYTNRQGRHVRPGWRNTGGGGSTTGRGNTGGNAGSGQTRQQSLGKKQTGDTKESLPQPKQYRPSLNMTPTQVITLNPQDVRRACTYTNRQGRHVRPGWRNTGGGGSTTGRGNTGGNAGSGQTRQQSLGKKQTGDTKESLPQPKQYRPSLNMTPTQVMPVLVSTSHFDAQTKTKNVEMDETRSKTGERTLCPMQWGLIPSWHKGNPVGLGYKMNNCRSEGMLMKASFKRPFEKGRRCVVLADGFYEWKTSKDGKKQPYFLYFNQDKPVADLHVDTDDTETELPDQEDMFEEEEIEGKEWTGHRLLTMAGLYDIWRPADGSDPVYTFTVITVESHPSLSWLHHRMPAMLDSEDAVRDWLDAGEIASKQAFNLIKAVDTLAWHPVSTQVNNSRYKGEDCVKPIDLDKPVISASTKLMSSWLSKGGKTSPQNSQEKAGHNESKKRSHSPPSKPNPMMAWLKKANSDEKIQKVTGGPPTPKKSKTH